MGTSDTDGSLTPTNFLLPGAGSAGPVDTDLEREGEIGFSPRGTGAAREEELPLPADTVADTAMQAPALPMPAPLASGTSGDPDSAFPRSAAGGGAAHRPQARRVVTMPDLARVPEEAKAAAAVAARAAENALDLGLLGSSADGAAHVH